MTSSRLLLALPSVLILLMLIVHSARALPRRRAIAFWLGVACYGLVRGAGVRWVSAQGLGGSFPYVLRDPLMTVAGVSMQEVAGWSIVLYLGWWLGASRTPRLFGQIARACLLLAAASWAIESSAIHVGWWRWTVPIPEGSTAGVPFIGIVDWFFSGTDFLLPFLSLTAPAMRAHPARYFTLLAFPLHFAAHLSIGPPAPWLPIPTLHLAHWVLLGGLLWLALRAKVEDRPFAMKGDVVRRLPAAVVFTMLAVLATVDLAVAKDPGLLVALAPLCLVGALMLIRPAAGGPAGSQRWPGEAPRRRISWLVVSILVVLAVAIHSAAARRQTELTRRLDEAMALRDRGELEPAARTLEDLVLRFPGSHVPGAVLGELRYREGRLDEAYRLMTRSTKIQQSYVDGFRYLAVIDLRRGDLDRAADRAGRGLEIDPDDPQLLYLRARARREPLIPAADRMRALGPKEAYALAALAFEVNDLAAASAMMDAGVARWPNERTFLQGRVKLALARGDREAARQAAAQWLLALPDDAGAVQAAQSLNAR